MKLGCVLGCVFAVLVHAAFLLFGAWIFPGLKKDKVQIQQVELLTDDDTAEKEKPKDEIPEEKPEELKSDAEDPPDASEIIRALEPSPMDMTPALDAASLSAIEAALDGEGGSGEFGSSVNFASGGSIAGHGPTGGLDEKMDSVFSLAEIDQRPRVIFQAAGVYPAEMRSTKLEALVTVLFVVDADGKVTMPRVEKSTHPAFEAPALAAVKKWKFEPALRGGERVSCKMRVGIRFQPN